MFALSLFLCDLFGSCSRCASCLSLLRREIMKCHGCAVEEIRNDIEAGEEKMNLTRFATPEGSADLATNMFSESMLQDKNTSRIANQKTLKSKNPGSLTSNKCLPSLFVYLFRFVFHMLAFIWSRSFDNGFLWTLRSISPSF